MMYGHNLNLFWSSGNVLLSILYFVLEKLEQLHAFSYTPSDGEVSQSAGWVLYDPSLEFGRMEIPPNTWKMSDINEEFKVKYSLAHCMLLVKIIATTMMIIMIK